MHMHAGARLAARAVAAAILVACGIAPATHATPVHAAIASPLPANRLEFGLANDPSQIGWMTSSGVPWKYRYQYLSAGVNTNTGWETWNSPAGAFATFYMDASQAGGYIPVFSYYELLQSTPHTGATESDRDFNNLNNAATMNAYYANFKLLMQKAGAFGHQVVVQVEPDLWGYLQQRAAGGSAAGVPASVANSNFPEAAGIPDTVQGFAWTLLHIRDLYATNAVLAIHASPWSSGRDIASDNDPMLNIQTQADSTAAFLSSAGITAHPPYSTWDVVFNDLDDHDAGWWEGNGGHHWWDPTNATFPNFTRYFDWVAELQAKTGRQQVAWQVPIGNQYFLTMNNTCGHYQDNVAQYFLAHTSALLNAGLVAVMFGAGNGCQTTNYDAGPGDGITNSSAPTTDIAGWCNACNTHTSTFADNDGGFLRIFVGQYYASIPAPQSRSVVTQSSTTAAAARGSNQTATASIGPRIAGSPPPSAGGRGAGTTRLAARSDVWARVLVDISRVTETLRLLTHS
jgi:hypothetical protein